MENIPEQFAQLKELLTEYFDSNLEYYKFSGFEKLIRITIALSLTALFFMLAMFALLFFGFGTAVWLSDLLGNEILGYMGTGTIYLILICLIYLLKKPLIERPFIKLFYRILYSKRPKN
ncbi:hypothetical protein DWB61_11375 [Ancylomarina euxinus]|uniref:Phage holin family protein n=1 Tax=Ancylomarina euxinus TaxID=2283627 RepID=A0A425Y040_9BACT|nr:hypothetical protein [Ancylomarina euxinus]MCZ4695347.1 hypothetical protein [Ancylomarina euxinus]MUP15543.1 hypothetical protein [Ancylomarina euxinus]RRG21013.1 hypothetical protein DWB61_11375 [Ancylomarina euxinus]